MSELIVTENGFVYTVNSISVICARKTLQGEIVYSYGIEGKGGKRLGQIITSKKLPHEEDKKRDKSITEILCVWADLKEEAEKIIKGLVNAFNNLTPEELEKLRGIPKECVSVKKQQHSAIELYDSVGEAFEGVSDFNQPVICYNKGVVYEHKIPLQNRRSGAQSYRTEYNIYCVKLSKHVRSNANYPIAVITAGHVLLPEGEIELYLNPSTELLKDKSPLSSPICDEGTFKEVVLVKEFRIESTEGEGEETRILSTEEMWEDFLESGRIFELTTPVPIEELKNVKNIDTVIELALTDGLQKDPSLVTLMKAQLPKPDPNMLSPDEYMPYAPSGIIVTNTKVGKTTTAHRISKNVVNRPTAANLLGFSTSDETHIGLLDGQVDSCFIDEYSESLEENVSNGLLSYMERGTTKTARGHGITANGYAPIIYMGNPKIEGVSEYDLLEYFRNNINQITNNPQALASRLGFLIFDNNMDKALGTPYDHEVSRKSLMVLRTLQEAFKKQFSELFRNREIREWLNTPFEDWFIKLLSEAADKSSLNEVKEFIRGVKDAHKHFRGTALHIAFTELYEPLLLTGNIDIQELLEKCNHWYQYLLTQTVQTFDQIVSIRLDNTIYLKILDSAPEYIKLFVKTSFLCDLDSGMLPMDSFENNYPEIASDKGKYINFGNLKNTLLKNKTKTCELLKKFGLKLTDYNGIVLAGVLNKGVYQIFREAYRETEGSQGSQGSKYYSDAYSEPSEPSEPCNLSIGGELSEQKDTEQSVSGMLKRELCGICNSPLNPGEGEQGPAGLGLIHSACKYKHIAIIILQEIPPFMGIDLRKYGPFKVGDIATVPVINALALIKKGVARRKE